MEIIKILNLDKPTSLVETKDCKAKILLTVELQDILNKQLKLCNVGVTFCECKGSGGIRMDGTCARCGNTLERAITITSVEERTSKKYQIIHSNVGDQTNELVGESICKEKILKEYIVLATQLGFEDDISTIIIDSSIPFTWSNQHGDSLELISTSVEEDIHTWEEVEEFGRQAFYNGREVERYNENGLAIFKRPTYNCYLRELDKNITSVEEKMYSLNIVKLAFCEGRKLTEDGWEEEDWSDWNNWIKENL